MIKHFKDYYWKAGKPIGKEVIDPSSPISYKIIVDPYFRRFSVEKYLEGTFDRVIYDSYLLDFRHVKPHEQAAWQREITEESDQKMVCFLRNQEDRAILIESHTYENGQARSCTLHSIHGIELSTHRMFYKALNDPFDGVVLYDIENRPIMKKTYEVDSESGEFTTLLSENWEMS